MSEATIRNFDYVIVGGGTAGCVLANRLSANPATKVLMIEAGGNGKAFYVNMPMGLAFLVGNPKYDWVYKSEPEPYLDGRRMNLPRGRLLGGSSSINGMVYVRGHAYDFDSWAQLGNRGWAWSDVLPYFKKSESFHRKDLESHGKDGDWSINDPGVRYDAIDAFREACIEQGIPATEDYNSGETEGVSYFVASIHKGQRNSTARAFLRPIENRSNLTVVTGAMVDRLTFDGKTARGVIYTHEGRTFEARAGSEIILSCGTYGTPAILERSGVGNAERLSELGIPVVHHLPGVGENLQDHWHIATKFRLRNTRTLNNFAATRLGKMMLGLRYIATKSGPLSGQPTLLAAFTKLMPDAPAPDAQIHVSATTSDGFAGKPHTFAGITASTCILRPHSRGHSHIGTTDPLAQPTILHNYLKEEYDREITVRAILKSREIAASPAMARFEPEEIAPGPKMTDFDDLLEFCKRTINTTFHPVGTCKMGHDPMAVVDDQLRVHGLSGLRIVDASIMPFVPSGNTAAPTVMIAEKASDLIRNSTSAAAAA